MLRIAIVTLVVLAGIDSVKFNGVHLHTATQIATSILRSFGLL
jgi:hypothetical protein